MYLLDNKLILIINFVMGVTTSNAEARKMLKVPTEFGCVKITVLSCQLESNCNDGNNIRPYVKVLISNMFRWTKVNYSQGFDSRFDETLVFPLNSCYKPYGRIMEAFVLDKNQQSGDKLVAYGLLDLDHYITKERQKKQHQVELKNQSNKIGTMNLIFEFQEQPHETLGFEIQTCELSNKPNHLLICWARIIVGEEVLETPQISNKEQKIVWDGQVYEIEVPECIDTAKIEVYEGKRLLGRVVLDVIELKKIQQKRSFKETMKNEQGVPSGTLSFSVSIGSSEQLERKAQQNKSENQPKNRETESKPKESLAQKKVERISEQRANAPLKTTESEKRDYENFQQMYQDDQMDVFKA